MPLLVSGEIGQQIEMELHSACDSVQIITAFCKQHTIKRLIACVPSNISNKKIMVRFRLGDLLAGVTDFDILEYSMSKGWHPFIRFDLHAKTYIIDNRRGIIGSANATTAGLYDSSFSNYEMAAIVAIDSNDLAKIEKLYKGAICVTPDVLSELKHEYNTNKKRAQAASPRWSKKIEQLFNPTVETLFMHEFPDKDDYVQGENISFLGILFEDKASAAECLRWSNAAIWLIQQLETSDGELYFGEMTKKLHNAIVSDPAPYRKDVKELLANLLALIEKWEMPGVQIDKPSYSQRIRLT